MAEHWACAYVGLEYKDESFDCAHLVEQVLREQFGRELNLPKEHAGEYREQQRQIAGAKADYIEAAPTTAPQDGDCVLIISRGRTEHIGVYALIHGLAYVLHNHRAAGRVCLHRISNLPAQGMSVEGIYTWK